MPLIKLTSATDDHDIYVESDHITSIEPQRTGNQSFLWMLNGNGRRVKESPTAIIAAIAEAEDDPCCDCEFGPDVRFELTPLAEEMLREAGKKVADKPVTLEQCQRDLGISGGWQRTEYPPIHTRRVPPGAMLELSAAQMTRLAEDLNRTLDELDEAQADAKVADERAEWFKKLAEQRLAELEQLKGDHRIVSAWYGELVDRHTDKVAEMRKLEASLKALDVKLGEKEREIEGMAWLHDGLRLANESIAKKDAEIAEHRHTADNLVRKLGEQAKELSEWRGGIRSVGMPWYVKPSDPAVNPKWSSTYNDFNRE